MQARSTETEAAMRNLLTTLFVGALLVSAAPAGFGASSQTDENEAARRPFKLHAYTNMQPADVIISEDGFCIPRRLKLSSILAEQIRQARAQTHANVAAVHYIVPGHTMTGI